MVHFNDLEASQRTTRAVDEDAPWPGSDAEATLAPGLLAGGKSLATQRSP